VVLCTSVSTARQGNHWTTSHAYGHLSKLQVIFNETNKNWFLYQQRNKYQRWPAPKKAGVR